MTTLYNKMKGFFGKNAQVTESFFCHATLNVAQFIDPCYGIFFFIANSPILLITLVSLHINNIIGIVSLSYTYPVIKMG